MIGQRWRQRQNKPNTPPLSLREWGCALSACYIMGEGRRFLKIYHHSLDIQWALSSLASAFLLTALSTLNGKEYRKWSRTCKLMQIWITEKTQLIKSGLLWALPYWEAFWQGSFFHMLRPTKILHVDLKTSSINATFSHSNRSMVVGAFGKPRIQPYNMGLANLLGVRKATWDLE